MSEISIRIMDRAGNILAQAHGCGEVNLVYGAEYQEGDHIAVEFEETRQFYWLQLDDARGSSLVYVTGGVDYEIPFGEKRLHLSPRVFAGESHLLHVRKARPYETDGYRNLALNVWDQHGQVNVYPHASANVETRGESTFAALNAIDGVTASESHGPWPYGSWGINRRDDAAMLLEFGRPVEVDRIVFYTRADFPHDNWWVQATVVFSDGSRQTFDLQKTGMAQEFVFEKKTIEWLRLEQLIKADDPSPFPALVELEVYGREAAGN